jgi:hypothetical protein
MTEPTLFNAADILSFGYDKREKFEEIKPLLEQIHSFMRENEIPYIFAANVVVNTDDRSHETATSASLIGMERTPPEMAVANMCVTQGLPAAIQLASFLLSLGYTGGVEQPIAADSSGPQPTVSGAGHA